MYLGNAERALEEADNHTLDPGTRSLERGKDGGVAQLPLYRSKPIRRVRGRNVRSVQEVLVIDWVVGGWVGGWVVPGRSLAIKT